jgi:predicted PurR-regulated permease PerM
MSLLARHSDRSVIFAARLLSTALIFGMLYGAKIVLIPLAFSLLIAFMLYPAVRWLRRFKLPHAAAVVITTTSALVVLAALTWSIGAQVVGFSAQLPQYRKNITEKISSVRGAMKGGTIEKLQDTLDTVVEDVEKMKEAEDKETEKKEREEQKKSREPVRTTPKPADAEPVAVYISSPPRLVDFDSLAALGPLMEPLTALGLVILLSLLMLMKWSELRARMLTFLEHNLASTTAAIDDAGTRIRTFLGIQFLYNTAFGTIVGVGLALLGVPYAALWGLCAAVFRYIPYVGPVIAAALPLLVSLVTSDGWSQVLSVGILFIVLELLSNNLIEPWLYGSRVGLSEIGIIVATVAWTFLWGPSGLVLATPLTVCLVVLGEHVPAFAFIARLLGSKPALSRHFHFYQRLLAGDILESADLARKSIQETDAETTMEKMFLPALALSRHEWMAGRLEADRAEQVADTLSAVFAKATQGEKDNDEGETAPGDAPMDSEATVPVSFWATCPMGDVVLPLQAAAMGSLRIVPDLVTSKQFAGSVTERLAADPPAAVCLIHLDPSDFTRVRGRVMRLRAALPQTPIIVARLGGAIFSAEEKATLAITGATALATTLDGLRSALAPRILDFAPAENPPA